jgi:predicted ATPase with chaperone activity
MPKTPSKTFKGQGKLCTGKLTITLAGPQGSGKSLVAKILRALLPLTPVNEVEIRTVSTL